MVHAESAAASSDIPNNPSASIMSTDPMMAGTFVNISLLATDLQQLAFIRRMQIGKVSLMPSKHTLVEISFITVHLGQL